MTSGKGVVLMYHHVAHALSNPLDLVVSPEHFAEHVEVISRHYEPVRLTDLSTGLLVGEVRHRSVAVTFDDGYVDNVMNAEPELARCQVPATMFVPCQSDGLRTEFWWDTLEHILLSDRPLPSSLRVSLAGSSFETLFDDSRDGFSRDVEQTRSWRVWDPPHNRRQEAFAALVRMLEPLPASERGHIVDELVAWAGGSGGAANARRLMDRELLEMAERGVIDLGAHGVSHGRLALMTPSEQMDEVEASRMYLHRLTGTVPPAFAYPSGSFSPETVGIVRAAGFSLACTTEPAAVEVGTDPFRLPRLHVGDESGQQLRQRMDRCLAHS